MNKQVKGAAVARAAPGWGLGLRASREPGGGESRKDHARMAVS